MMKGVVLAFLLLSGCCRTCPPPKVVVQRVAEPCLVEKYPRGGAVEAPKSCTADASPDKCAGCLPGKTCYKLAEASKLATNVEDLLSWAKRAEARCLGPRPVTPQK